MHGGGKIGTAIASIASFHPSASPPPPPRPRPPRPPMSSNQTSRDPSPKPGKQVDTMDQCESATETEAATTEQSIVAGSPKPKDPADQSAEPEDKPNPKKG